jgi:hypothetical protein
MLKSHSIRPHHQRPNPKSVPARRARRATRAATATPARAFAHRALGQPPLKFSDLPPPCPSANRRRPAGDRGSSLASSSEPTRDCQNSPASTPPTDFQGAGSSRGCTRSTRPAAPASNRDELATASDSGDCASPRACAFAPWTDRSNEKSPEPRQRKIPHLPDRTGANPYHPYPRHYPGRDSARPDRESGTAREFGRSRAIRPLVARVPRSFSG